MFRFLLSITFLAVALLGGAGCAGHAKKKKPEHAATGPQSLFVGTISLVNEAQHFALIDNGTSPAPASGMILKSYTGETVSGELTTSNVRRHPFVIADIQSGSPQKGDRVFYEINKSGKTPAPAPAPPVVAPPTAPPSRSGLPEGSLPPHFPPPMLGLPPSPTDQ